MGLSKGEMIFYSEVSMVWYTKFLVSFPHAPDVPCFLKFLASLLIFHHETFTYLLWEIMWKGKNCLNHSPEFDSKADNFN